MTNYNGWKNRETWNVALWLGNHEGLYETARKFKRYSDLVKYLAYYNHTRTPDGVSYKSRKVSRRELNEFLKGIR